MASSYLPLADLIGSGSYMRLSRFLSHFVVLIGRYKVMLVKRFQNCEGQKLERMLMRRKIIAEEEGNNKDIMIVCEYIELFWPLIFCFVIFCLAHLSWSLFSHIGLPQ